MGKGTTSGDGSMPQSPEVLWYGLARGGIDNCGRAVLGVVEEYEVGVRRRRQGVSVVTQHVP